MNTILGHLNNFIINDNLYFLAIELFFWSMLIRMTWQLKILSRAIETIDTIQDVPYISKMDIQFCKCVNELQHLICLLENLKYIYRTPLLLQYIFTVLVTCTLVYSVPQEDNISLIIGLLSFVLMALSDLFFNLLLITMVTSQVI